MMYDTFMKDRRKSNYTILLRSTKGISYYGQQKTRGKIKIHLSEKMTSLYEFHGTVAHEFRHFVQDVVFRVPWTKKEYDDSTDEKYYNSPAEIDAIKFDTVVTDKVIRLHNRLKKVKSSYKKYSKYKFRVS